MARISKLNDKIPNENKINLSTCLFCGENVMVGGCWTGEKEIAVCGNCINSLIDLAIDTIDDTTNIKKLSDSEQLTYIKNLVENRLLKKKTLINEN